jgi:pimeloyl-ACP methyl ester carboxylesterase
MATFVLVHGAFGGGWEWKKLAALLAADGHEVLAPTLTGLADRAHLATPDLGLEAHVQDIVAVLEFEDLRDAILVGYSYSGMVTTGVADRAADRIAHLVYLDAHAPRDGESLIDISPPGRRAALEEAARAGGDGWRIPPPSVEGLLPLAEQGRFPASDVSWFGARLRPQPLRTFLDPVRLTNPAALVPPRTYIFCAEADPGFVQSHLRSAERAKAAGWPYHELPTGHVSVLFEPRGLADLLLALA